MAENPILKNQSDLASYKAASVIALAGNPNVGKSTVFNALTGMNQHTGNWTGKTVATAKGVCKNKNKEYMLIDIPGTYSLSPNSPEEEVARDFICFGKYDAVIVVCDATCLERNLNLVLQIMEVAKKVIVCVNLIDEAEKKGIKIDLEMLSRKLNVAVVGTVARRKKSLKSLLDTLSYVCADTKENDFKINYPASVEKAIEILMPELRKRTGDEHTARWSALKLLENESSADELKARLDFDDNLSVGLENALNAFSAEKTDNKTFSDTVVSATVLKAEEICREVVKNPENYNSRDLKIDSILTGKKIGYPVMLCLLALIFWITITGANYISECLSSLFSVAELYLTRFLEFLNAPSLLKSFVIEGIYRVPTTVISVMLPPMAIFFPLFTLLEDLGYLPRIAYNLDKPFKCCGGCGKQALSMCMGFGCNAAGVTGCRIIDSERERMLAILTNSFVPCNGRFPTIIAMITMFFAIGSGFVGSVTSALILTAVIMLGVLMTFAATKLLSSTLLKGMNASYTLELPSYRKPQIASVVVRSVFDRTLFVLGRSVSVAIPAGIIIWGMANLKIGDMSLLSYAADFLEPIGKLMGLDGVILLAFILGFPANEIVVPIALMIYLSGNTLAYISSAEEMRQILLANGWNWVTALCMIIFSLFHWPCSTTVLTVKKETGSFKWALFSIAFPTAFGAAICMLISFVF